MKKEYTEKHKKIAVVAGLMIVGTLAVTGICICLHKDEPVGYVVEEGEQPVEMIQIDTEIAVPSIEMPDKEKDAAFQESSEETELIISSEAATEKTEKEPVQALQKKPEKTENVKPENPPEETTKADTNNESSQPENKEIPAQVTQTETSSDISQHGTVMDGKIYVDGFGWIDYNGGETEVIQGAGIYENGNTVGIMD